MDRKMDAVAFCGLNCDDCFIREGELAGLASRFLNKAGAVRLEERAAGFAGLGGDLATLNDYSKCKSVLAALAGLRCSKFCRQGGGTTDCAIRSCCLEKGFVGCWECETFESCPTLRVLEPVNSDAHLKNLRVIREKGMNVFLSGERYW